MTRVNFVCLLSFCMCLAARDLPVINIPDQGNIVGKEIAKSRVQKIIGYFGIPYAHPPIDSLRFAPPKTDPAVAWDTVLNATEHRPACLQTDTDIRDEAKPFYDLIYSGYNNLTMDEDCLYLNVFVPYGNSPSSGFATVIWIHPGNFTTGAASMWNPHTLVYRNRIIVVTLNWRLNIMGFFSTGDGEAPGNFGLMDQQAAMMWVSKNVKHFGGNENNICLMGYGAGGVSVGIHMINENSRQYFHKAIIMSANILSPSTVKQHKEDKHFLDTLAEEYGCIRKPTSKLIQCLRVPEGKSLVKETTQNNWRPLLDNNLSNNTTPFLTDLPKTFFERGDFHKIPILTGYTNMEEILRVSNLLADYETNNVSSDNLQQVLNDLTNNDIPTSNNTESSCSSNFDHVNDAVMFFYGPPTAVKDADALRKIVADFTTEKNYGASTYLHSTYTCKENLTFVYRFDMKPVTEIATRNLPDWVGVPHLYDLIYVWGVPYWQEFEGNSWESHDKRFSDIVMAFWTTFAKMSNPTERSLYRIQWDSFTSDDPKLLIIDSAFNMSNNKNLNYKAFEFWNEYYPKVLDVASQCCNSTDDAWIIKVSTFWLFFTQCFLQFIFQY